MASAIRTPVPGVELRLTADEARTLCDVLSSVGGDPKTSRRRYSSAVLTALLEAGFCSTLYNAWDLSGTLTFEVRS